MVPLRTGAARIALAAEQEAGGELGLRIVPVGLTWERKHLFGGRVLVEIGEAFPVRPWLTGAGADDAEAVWALTEEIGRRLRGVTVNLPSTEDRDLVAAADRLYSRQKRIHGYRERDPLSRRVPRLRRFAEALKWLRREDPARYRRLAGRVRRHDRVVRLLGVEEGDVPSRYRARSVARYTFQQGAALLLGLPLAAVGTLIWYPTWLLPRWLVARVRPEHESVASYKLATGFVTVPLTVAGSSILAFLAWGMLGAIVTAVVVPLLGLVAMAWRGRWERVREDVALFVRVLGRPRLRRMLARRRAELAAEFDRVVAEMES